MAIKGAIRPVPHYDDGFGRDPANSLVCGAIMTQQQVLERKTFAAGDVIFNKGDAGNIAYVVQSGEVEIFLELPEGEKVLGTVGKGGIFGEMALIDDKPRMAGARATGPTTLIVVSRMSFRKKLEKADPFIRGLLNILADNLRRMANND